MKISKKRAEIFIQFFIIFMPEIFTQIKPLFYFFSICAVFIFMYFLFFFIKNKILPIYILLWLFICIYLLIIMFLNGNLSDIDQWGKRIIFVSDLMFLLEYNIKKGRSKDLLSTVTVLGITMLTVNVISFIILPNGFIHTIDGNYYFLGTRNNFLKYFFAFFAVSGLQFVYDRRKIKEVIIIIMLSLIQFIYFQVSTAITCILLLSALFFLKKELKGILNMKLILTITTLLSIGFVFFEASSIFSWFIINFLHKDVGMNSRYLIWDSAVQIIFSDNIKLVFGNGIYNNGNFIYLYELYWPAHNQLLEWIFEYGLVGTGLLYFYYLKLDKKTNYGNDSFFLLSICFVIFTASISSGPLGSAPGYMALCLLPYLDNLRKDYIYG